MKAHHHASDLVTVPYAPRVPGKEVAGGRVDLAYSATCHFCDVTHISVIRAFPVPYRCATCAAIVPAPKEPEPEVLTPAQAGLLARIEKISGRITELDDRVAAERVRRDDLFFKAHGHALSTRRLGASAQMSSPGVASAIARARRRSEK